MLDHVGRMPTWIVRSLREVSCPMMMVIAGKHRQAKLARNETAAGHPIAMTSMRVVASVG